MNSTAQLTVALMEARKTIRLLHGAGFKSKREERRAWAAYQHSPEMQQINAALKAVVGLDSALLDPDIGPDLRLQRELGEQPADNSRKEVHA